MKNHGPTPALLSPDAHGWRVSVAGADGQSVATLGEAVASLPANANIELALPCQAVLIERHRLPSTDRAELADMLQLQLEKTLPYPLDDVSHGFEVLGQDENESTVLAVAASRAQLEELCAPLRQKGHLPARITIEALRVAASCPENGTVLALWPEQEQTACAIITDGRLAWAQPIVGLDAAAVLAELPGLLIAAELAGVSTDFSEIRIAGESSALREALSEKFGKPVTDIGALSGPKAALDLLPENWQAEARRQERGDRLKQNLLVAAVAYLVLIAGAFGYLAWLKRQAAVLQREHDSMKPRFAGIEAQMKRWDLLSPAVEPSRYIVEVIHQLAKAKAEVKGVELTTFTFGPMTWSVKCEGTTDGRFDLVTRLKANKELDKFALNFPAEQPIANTEKYTFSVEGKAR